MLKIETPLKKEEIEGLKVGDEVLLTGTIFTARDAAHKRFMEALDNGDSLPIDLAGQVIFYAGPTPAGPGRTIGSIGPTTAGRMDPFTPRLLKLGLKGMIGKGARSKEVKQAIKDYGAVYFAATGGAAALLSEFVQGAKVVAYEDLGPEAVFQLEVENFPLIVAVDSRGGDIYVEL
ncbi:MAG: Fe-S-containing hydro-lyase [Actinomycetota bacterium]|nr:Fe-S-containing hydro-lyase [Actinomycetota bacterium]